MKSIRNLHLYHALLIVIRGVSGLVPLASMRPAPRQRPLLRMSTVEFPTKVSKNQEELDGKLFPRTWVPLASTLELDPDRPTPLKFLGQRYVVYQDNEENWVVVDDVCPHRLAPLSEGRVNRANNTLQCSYHGWEFDSKGSCQRIPQATEATQEAAMKMTRSCVASYPVFVQHGLVFVWPWKDDVLTTAEHVWATPEGMLEGVGETQSTYTRDLPYGWDTLVENLLDPSHVPFAHHGLQGTREDAIPINMTKPVDLGEKGFQFEWSDRTMKLMRSGDGFFRAPLLVRYEAEFENPKRPFRLSVFCIPIQPGWSRVILLSTKQKQDDEEEKKLANKPIQNSLRRRLLRMIFRNIPVWVSHQLSHRFFDSDLAFLHFQEQERARHEKAPYFMPAQADRCVTALREWMSQYTNITNEALPPTPTSRATLFDHYSQHTIHCKSCQDALLGLKKWRKRTYGLLVASILGFQFQIAKISLILSLALLKIFPKIERSFREGDFKHYQNH